MNHIVIIILDSCRFDSFKEARAPFLHGLPTSAEKRYSYASWTAPSHFNLMMGLMPHSNPVDRYASQLYQREFSLWSERVDVPLVDFKSFLPDLWLPKMLKSFGYETHARVSMPVLNPATTLNRDFDDYILMPNHNSLDAILDEVRLGSVPSFWLINTGETHYPYMLRDSSLPIVSGLHGAVKGIRQADDAQIAVEDKSVSSDFTMDQMKTLYNAQKRAVGYTDRLIADFARKAPDNTQLIVTSDHGELFGEDGFFGHGPICHPKVNEVPYLEFHRSSIIL